MTPLFIHICSNGQIWATQDAAFSPSGLTVLATFRVNSLLTSQKICTLTGSGNASASALAVNAATKSGKNSEIV